MKLSKRECLVLWVALTLIILMFLVPPWQRTFRGSDYFKAYALVFTPPDNYCRINWARLIAQWVIVAVVAGAAIFTLRTRTPKDGT